ncbi:hypothetical protein EDB19DRAFT_1832444 [Suillus lakei]|nr:hypothetical protein EDB19DRAFT_1832444 [Suillus lakei]
MNIAQVKMLGHACAFGLAFSMLPLRSAIALPLLMRASTSTLDGGGLVLVTSRPMLHLGSSHMKFLDTVDGMRRDGGVAWQRKFDHLIAVFMTNGRASFLRSQGMEIEEKAGLRISGHKHLRDWCIHIKTVACLNLVNAIATLGTGSIKAPPGINISLDRWQVPNSRPVVITWFHKWFTDW